MNGCFQPAHPFILISKLFPSATDVCLWRPPFLACERVTSWKPQFICKGSSWECHRRARPSHIRLLAALVLLLAILGLNGWQQLRVAIATRHNASNGTGRTDGYSSIGHADQLELDGFDR